MSEILQFKAITGVEDENIVAKFLNQANNNLLHALNYYFMDNDNDNERENEINSNLAKPSRSKAKKPNKKKKNEILGK